MTGEDIAMDLAEAEAAKLDEEQRLLDAEMEATPPEQRPARREERMRRTMRIIERTGALVKVMQAARRDTPDTPQ